MDLIHWLGLVVTALTSAAITLGGAWFWIRRNQLKLRGDANAQLSEESATAVKAWRELMEYKSDDFRKKNSEQDTRSAAMLLKLDEMHAAHLKCERDAAAREIVFQREAAAREIKLSGHEAKIVELSEQVTSLRSGLEVMRVQQLTQQHEQANRTLEVAAQKVLQVAEKVAEQKVTDANNAK